MRIIFLFLLTLLFSNQTFAISEATIKANTSRLKQLQIKVSKQCLENRNSEDVRIKVDNIVYTCPQMIVITDRLARQLDDQISEYKETCEENNQKAQHAKLATEAANLAKKAATCSPSPDRNQCLGKFMCGVVTTAVPVTAIAAVLSKNPTVRGCVAQAKQMPGCLASVLRGIFDSIWGSIKMLWDGAKWVAKKAGEFLGFIKRSEAKTSEKAMLAQQAGPGLLRQLITNPLATMKKMASNLYESLEAAAMNHYGCEKWSGLPFRSTCLRPMTTWKCGTCQQKTQVYCGIAGYAAGEIGTAFLTGGLLSGGKIALKGAVKIASGPARNVAAFLGKTFPKSASAVAKAAGTVKMLAQVGLTAAQKRLISGWQAVKNSRATKVFAEAADDVSKSLAGKAARTALKPVSLYLRAMDNAFIAGQNVVEAGAKSVATKVVREEALRGAKIADEAMEVAPEAAVAATLSSKVDDASRSSGIVIESSGTKVRLTPSIPVRAKSSKASAEANRIEDMATRPLTNTEKSAAKAADNADEVSDVVKFRTDPEYADLFKGKELYEGHHDELAMVIRAMEETQPKMTKIQIRTKIQETLNSCQL